LPIAGSPSEARAELESLLGMSRAQFCQVVLLPQGGFARFLHAGSQERGDLLRELFDLGRFADVEAWLKSRARDAERRLAEAQRGVREALARAGQAAGVDVPEDVAAGGGDALAWLEEAIVVAEASAATAADAREAARGAEERARAALQAGEALVRARSAAADAARELDEHAATRAGRDSDAQALDAARRAAPCEPAVATLARAVQELREAEQAAGRARAAAPLEERAAPALFDADGRGEADRLRARAGSLRVAAGTAGAHAEREARVAAACAEVEQLRARAAGAAGRVQELTRRLDQDAAARPRLDVACDRARTAATALQGLQEGAAQAARSAAAAQRRDRLAVEHDAALAAAARLREAAAVARERWLAVREARLDGMAAVLAADLRDGEPCAVCGAREHPAPARPDGDGGVPDEAAEAAARTAWEAAEAEHRAAGERVAELAAALAGERALAGDVPTDVLAEAARKAQAAQAAAARDATRVAEALRALEELDARVREAQDARREAELEQERWRVAAATRAAEVEEDQRVLAQARGAQATIAERVRELERLADLADAAAEAVEAEARAAAAADAARAAARAAAGAAGFADEAAVRAALLPAGQLAALEAAVRAWDETLAERRACAQQLRDAALAAEPAWAGARDAVRGPARDVTADAEAARLAQAGLRPFAGGGSPEPDAEPDVAALEHAATEAAQRAAAAERAAARAGARQEELVALREVLEQRLAEAEPARAQHALLRELATLADGSSSANRLSMRLSAYVLAARLEEVAQAASVRLQRMSEGRYSLEHADDTGSGSRRGGLDLRVLDAWTGRHRRPSSLSGGETFFASLALALGLADVVTAESGGTRLDTLFVDEGFGSLDDEGTLDQVLDVLEDLREGGRVVGVVSHVAELRRRIPVQLRVERGHTGSQVLQDEVGAAAG
ncbi:MAG TPA: hypothetical protein VD931_17135, partial [Baekduia sp.]|nr:hypothetical protein [Baekduia sp.]